MYILLAILFLVSVNKLLFGPFVALFANSSANVMNKKPLKLPFVLFVIGYINEIWKEPK